MPYVYIVLCGDGTYYTGSTKNLEKRIWEHQNLMGSNYTKNRQPINLVFYEQYDSIDKAFEREKQIQKWSHSKKTALIEANWQKLKKLLECQNKSHFKNRTA